MTARAIPLVLLIIVTACTPEQPLGEGHYRWEGIRGFAIWPEDQPELALEACEEDADDEPWRRAAGETAAAFVTSVLGWKQPPDLSDHEVLEDAPRTVFSMTAGDMRDDALGVVVHLRPLRGCWFVAAVWPREGDAGGAARWVERGGRYVLRASWDGRTPINLEVGWGEHVERRVLRRGDKVDVIPPDPGMSGHILWFYEEASEHTFGQPLSPPAHLP